MGDRQLAAFDFDGTITERDTLFGFLRLAFGETALGRSLLSCALPVAAARLAGTRRELHPRDVGKAALLRSLTRDRSISEVIDAGSSYARQLPARFRPDVLARLQWHRAEGHDIVLVSASLRYYLTPLREELGFVEVLACEMAVDGSGRLTGELARPNVRGPEKEVRLREWMEGRDPYESIWAYGNSAGDRELLAMSDHPTMIGKTPIPPEPVEKQIDRR